MRFTVLQPGAHIHVPGRFTPYTLPREAEIDITDDEVIESLKRCPQSVTPIVPPKEGKKTHEK